MFEWLGHFVARTWGIFLGVWIVALVLLISVAPKWDDVVYDGEFRFLPDYAPSRKAEDLFSKSFSNDILGSSIVIVVRRDTSDGLLDEDKSYIDDVLVPRLKRTVGMAPSTEEGIEGSTDTAEQEAAPKSDTKASQPKSKAAGPAAPVDVKAAEADAKKKPDAKKPADGPGTPIDSTVARIRTFSDKELGQLLVSEDNKATLVILELTSDFTERRNEPTIAKVEELVGLPGHAGALQREKGYPAGLDLALSGSATVGRDMRAAARKSAHATEMATVVLVILLLLAIYRAPIVAVIPLVTVLVSVKIAILILSLFATIDWVRLFSGLEVYVIVVCYGAGIDYCMFLMSRYKEELDNGATFDEAIAISVSRVGHALAASAGTVMCGIGMMYFTRFGKFQEAGIAMSFSLVFVLTASLTLTPALLRLAGRWTFWPHVQTERLSAAQGWIAPTSLISRLFEREWLGPVWDKIGNALLVRAGRIWIAAFLLMTPFAVVALVWQHKLSYGLLSELPATDPSVSGAAAVQAHFPAGVTGPVTILVENQNADFHPNPASDDEKRPGFEQVRDFVDSMYDHRDELGIVDIRSVAYPLGMSDRVRSNLNFATKRVLLRRAQSRYVADKAGLDGKVTRIDVVFKNDPFSPDSIREFDHLKQAAPTFLSGPLRPEDTNLAFLGATASIRDLKTITGLDQTRIDFLVPTVVFLILVLLLRRVVTSAYLIFTVFFSYLVTLGLTFVVFYCLDRHGFVGLDWKVPMFLFTILVAVGEDYNILLMSRIEEEQRVHGTIQGIIVGLRKTGGIISSCGIIMAGTFSALMFGTLQGLAQLGFALAFGVLLDTFVVRPILVPAYLILLNQGCFGPLGRFLGAESPGEGSRQPRKAGEHCQAGIDVSAERTAGAQGSKSSGSDAERV